MPQHTPEKRRQNRLAAINLQQGRAGPKEVAIADNPRARRRKSKSRKRERKGILKGATFE